MAISEVVDRAVQSKPDDRFPTAAAMLKALADCRRVLSYVEAPSLSIYDSPDRAEHIIQNWGREEKAADNSGLRRERFRQAAQRRKPMILGMLFLLTVWAIFYYRNLSKYISEQNQLVMEALTDGVPGPGWRLETVRGLFPADGLGLGPPWDSPTRSGCSFVTMAKVHKVNFMSFRVRRLKSAPRLLVYSEPWGVVMEPRENRYLARLVRVPADFTLEEGHVQNHDALQPLPFDLGRSLGVRLSVDGNVGQLTVGRNTRRFRTKEGWNSKACGVVLLNAVNRTRCLVEDWQVK